MPRRRSTFVALLALFASAATGATRGLAASPSTPSTAPEAPGAAAPESGSETPAGDSSTPTLEEVMADPNRTVGFLPKTFRLPDGAERIYQVWVPLDYDPKKPWPTILFLHGRGECGTDGEKVLKQGVPKEIKRRKGDFPFIVVIPQSMGGWSDDNRKVAVGALKQTVRQYAVDTDRVYLTGLSMGGFGTFQLAEAYPRSFAAVVPICGGTDPSAAAKVRHIPIWVWHGSEDNVVEPENSRKIVAALVKARARELRYTEVPGVKHNSWDRAYPDDALWEWLLAHRLRDLRRSQRPLPPVIDAPPRGRRRRAVKEEAPLRR